MMPRFTASAAGIAAPVAMSALREKMPSMSFSDSSLAWISAPLLEMSAAVALPRAPLMASGLGAETAMPWHTALTPASMSWACLAGSLLDAW